MTFQEQLKSFGACKEAIKWVGTMDMGSAWGVCPRGDWMLWLYQRLYPNNLLEMATAKALCAETIKNNIKDQRSLSAIDKALEFGRGGASIAELQEVSINAVAALEDIANPVVSSDKTQSSYYNDDYVAQNAAYAALSTVELSSSLTAKYTAKVAYASAAIAFSSNDKLKSYIPDPPTSFPSQAAANIAGAFKFDIDCTKMAEAAEKKNQADTAKICRDNLNINGG